MRDGACASFSLITRPREGHRPLPALPLPLLPVNNCVRVGAHKYHARCWADIQEGKAYELLTSVLPRSLPKDQ